MKVMTRLWSPATLPPRTKVVPAPAFGAWGVVFARGHTDRWRPCGCPGPRNPKAPLDLGRRRARSLRRSLAGRSADRPGDGLSVPAAPRVPIGLGPPVPGGVGGRHVRHRPWRLPRSGMQNRASLGNEDLCFTLGSAKFRTFVPGFAWWPLRTLENQTEHFSTLSADPRLGEDAEKS